MKDKTIIVPVLVLYLGLWVFTGTATSSAIAILEKVNASRNFPLVSGNSHSHTYVREKL